MISYLSTSFLVGTTIEVVGMKKSQFGGSGDNAVPAGPQTVRQPGHHQLRGADVRGGDEVRPLGTPASRAFPFEEDGGGG